jgi:hypothetical protein
MKKYTAASVAVVLLLLAFPGRSMAQDVVSNNGVKGCVGLGMLAGELVVTIEAVSGVKKAWILAVTGLVAAGGGAAGGYFAETKPSADTGAQVGVGLLAGGMAFFVPTMIIATAMLKYSGKKEASTAVEVTTEKSSGTETPSEEKAEPAPATEEGGGATTPSAMINVKGKSLSLAVPPLMVLPVFSDEEVGFLTGDQALEYRLNVFNLVF